ncbi:MAG: intradiol ring-cleavage dioxygenase, partial [Thermoleophilia bacterium]|nr:intradiol ring-cleavage dioxygenase [Thermoleophilia bacterium]
MSQEHEVHDHDRGLAFDVSTLVSRRRALQLLAVGGLTALAGCGSSSSGGTTAAGTTAAAGTTTTTTSGGTAAVPASTIPEETAGPYPGDGSNGPNVLTESGIVRSDLTASFAGSTGSAEGVPLTMTFRLLDISEGGVPLAGAAVYAWHCDREGRYSLYSDGVTDQNWLRGVQETGADGAVTFTSIFPGCYPGRWPHVHFEVYPSLADATSAGSKLVTSQLAFPEDACEAAYAADGYAQSLANLGGVSLDTDMVFADGYATQLGTVTGDAAGGM